VLLERLSPIERAVFLLHEVFDYGYPEIARMVDKSEANCRQLAHRAREHVSAGGQRFDVAPEQLEDLTYRFLKASGNGDMQALIELLTDDAVLYSDGGGKVPAAINPIYGPDKIARFFIGLAQKMPPNTRFRPARVNGRPGYIAYVDGAVYMVAQVSFAGEKVSAFHIVRNPEKLRHVAGLPA